MKGFIFGLILGAAGTIVGMHYCGQIHVEFLADYIPTIEKAEEAAPAEEAAAPAEEVMEEAAEEAMEEASDTMEEAAAEEGGEEAAAEEGGEEAAAE